MKTQKLFISPANCRAPAEAEEKAKLTFSEDGKTITGVKDKSIKSITIPDSVTSIGSGAFSWCSSLTDITIPDSATSIGSGAFEHCISLTSVAIGNGVTSIGDRAFTGVQSVQVSAGHSVFSVDERGAVINKKEKKLLYVPPSLSSYTIPDSVTSIGSGAFNWCTSLTSVTIPDSVTSIGKSAFYGCKSLTSVTIPDSVTSIGESAFSSCEALTSVTIPSRVTSIGERAFRGVQSVQVSAENPVFSVDESGVLINKKEKKLLYVPRSLSGSYTIPDSVTSIGESAFSGCEALTSVTIPDSVTSIGDWAFSGSKSLTSVTIPAKFTDKDVNRWFYGDLFILNKIGKSSNCKIIRR